MIECGFVATDDQALAARPYRRLRVDPRFAQQILRSERCVHDPWIIAQKLGSEVSAAKSSDGPNPYFVHNKILYLIIHVLYIYNN